MQVQWMSRENGFKDLVHLDTGNILASTNLDVSSEEFDLDIGNLQMKYERKWVEKERVVEIKPKRKLVKNSIKCKTCKEILISRYTHDFQQCDCGNFVDGGLAYQRWGGDPDNIEDLSVWADEIV